MGWPLAIAALGASLAGNELNRQAQVKAAQKRQRMAVEGIRRRTQKANERLTPLFKQASEDVGTKKEKELFTSEDAKNLATINKTKSMMDNRLTGGLETGGKKSAEFQSLQSDRFTKSKAGQDKRDLAMSRFLSPSRVGQIRGQAVNDVAFGRASVADELIADRNINDMRISAVKSEGSVLGDILRIAGMAGSIYNMGAGMGAGATTSGGLNAGSYAGLGDVSAGASNFSNISTGANAIGGSVGANMATQAGSWTAPFLNAYDSVGSYFQPTSSILPQQASRLTTPAFGARNMFAPTDAINMGPQNPTFQKWNLPQR